MLTGKLKEEWEQIAPNRKGLAWQDVRGFHYMDFYLLESKISKELELALADAWRHKIVNSKYGTQYVPVDLKCNRDDKGLHFLITYIESVRL